MSTTPHQSVIIGSPHESGEDVGFVIAVQENLTEMFGARDVTMANGITIHPNEEIGWYKEKKAIGLAPGEGIVFVPTDIFDEVSATIEKYLMFLTDKEGVKPSLESSVGSPRKGEVYLTAELMKVEVIRKASDRVILYNHDTNKTQSINFGGEGFAAMFAYLYIAKDGTNVLPDTVKEMREDYLVATARQAEVDEDDDDDDDDYDEEWDD